MVHRYHIAYYTSSTVHMISQFLGHISCCIPLSYSILLWYSLISRLSLLFDLTNLSLDSPLAENSIIQRLITLSTYLRLLIFVLLNIRTRYLIVIFLFFVYISLLFLSRFSYLILCLRTHRTFSISSCTYLLCFVFSYC